MNCKFFIINPVFTQLKKIYFSNLNATSKPQFEETQESEINTCIYDQKSPLGALANQQGITVYK